MYFTSVTRFSPEHGRTLPYYKIKESFRDVLGHVHTRVMLTPGYLPDLCCDEIVQIRRGLTYLMEQSAFILEQPTLFPTDPRTGYSEKVCAYIDKFGEAIKSSGKIDTARDSYDKAEQKARRLIDVNTIKHTDVREVGAENVCLQTLRELQIEKFLRREGWSEHRINATLAALIVRTIYAPSEWKSLRSWKRTRQPWNCSRVTSATCPLSGKYMPLHHRSTHSRTNWSATCAHAPTPSSTSPTA